jgi:hypothetical protein
MPTTNRGVALRVNERRFQMTTTIRRIAALTVGCVDAQAAAPCLLGVGQQDRKCLRSTVGGDDSNQAASDELWALEARA